MHIATLRTASAHTKKFVANDPTGFIPKQTLKRFSFACKVRKPLPGLKNRTGN